MAVKVLRPEFGASVGAERFQKEIGIVARMTHPHILPLFDSGEAEGALFYVMPYVEGETLRSRLRSTGRLPLSEAIQIASDVADALSYAHRQGVIHRDIKPENILLEEGKAVVADFGIARALEVAGEASLTSTGVAIGTPQYMSPEQGMGTESITESADVYALGCVFFEMLVGEPPFSSPSARVLIARKLHQSPPSPLSKRPEIPVWLDRMVLKMMARNPEDRFPSADALVAEISAHGNTSTDEPSDRWVRWAYRVYQRRWPLLAGATALLAVGIYQILRGGIPGFTDTQSSPPDTTRYAIFAYQPDDLSGTPTDAADRLKEALDRWEGASVVPLPLVREAQAQMDGGRTSTLEAAEVARSLGAGRFILESTGRLGEELRVSADLHDTDEPGRSLGTFNIRLPTNLEGADSIFSGLAERILFRQAAEGLEVPSHGTRSLPARHAFLAGRDLVRSWNLQAADSAFSEAVKIDPGYAEASLWVALSRAWRGLDVAEWRSPARRATVGSGLSQRSRLMADAVLAQNRGDLEAACGLWEELTRQDPDYFGGWYGSATCLHADDRVLPDPDSPSGWRFRTSYHHALRAFERAFELFPPILGSYREASYDGLRLLFMTTASARRLGQSDPSQTRDFVAIPAWTGDSLALIPYPREATETRLTVTPQELETAVTRLRERFNEVTRAWVTSMPISADAAEALAISRSILSDPEALTEIRRARNLAGEDGQRLRIAATEVWILLAFSLPSDLDGIQRAAALADSILPEEGEMTPSDPILLAGLAALLGRGHQGAHMARQIPLGGVFDGSILAGEDAPVLLMYSAMGGPPDSLQVLEGRVRGAFEAHLPPGVRLAASQEWLARAATLAFPEYRMDALTDLQGQGDPLLDSQAALVEGDTLAASRALDALSSAREGLLPSSLTLDGLLPEAGLLAQMGRPGAAVDLLDPTMQALPPAVPRFMGDPIRGAVLSRAMELRTRLAHRMGQDEEASTWREALMALWSQADPFLQSRLRELRELF